MALTIQEEAGGNIVTVTASGKLTKDDYVQFVPQFEALIKRAGKIQILFIMQDFHGWNLGATWEDIKFDARHFADIDRIAMVGDARWEQWMATICKPFTTASIRFFFQSDIDAARAWLGAPVHAVQGAA